MKKKMILLLLSFLFISCTDLQKNKGKITQPKTVKHDNKEDYQKLDSEKYFLLKKRAEMIDEICKLEIERLEILAKYNEVKELNEYLVEKNQSLTKHSSDLFEKNTQLAKEKNKILKKYALEQSKKEKEPIEKTEAKENLDNKQEVYVVKKGDTVAKIAKKFSKKEDDIVLENENIKEGQSLQTGSKLFLRDISGFIYVVDAGDTLYDISNKFKVSHLDIMDKNNKKDQQIFAGEQLIIPFAFPKEEFVNPLKDHTVEITSYFGKRMHPIKKRILHHSGIDLKAKIGTQVLASMDGVVMFAGHASGYGNLVKLKHEDGYITYYGHLSKYNVKKGDKVVAGQLIAKTGNTGISSGPHLHFEIRHKNKPINPVCFLKEHKNIINKKRHYVKSDIESNKKMARN